MAIKAGSGILDLDPLANRLVAEGHDCRGSDQQALALCGGQIITLHPIGEAEDHLATVMLKRLGIGWQLTNFGRAIRVQQKRLFTVAARKIIGFPVISPAWQIVAFQHPIVIRHARRAFQKACSNHFTPADVVIDIDAHPRLKIADIGGQAQQHVVIGRFRTDMGKPACPDDRNRCARAIGQHRKQAVRSRIDGVREDPRQINPAFLGKPGLGCPLGIGPGGQ